MNDRIRPARTEDAEYVRRLMETLENENFDAEIFRSRLERFLAKPRYIALVYDDGGVRGFLSARWEETLHRHGVSAEILDLCVDPVCRGRGIGTALMDEAEHLLADHGAEMIEVSSGTDRRDVHRFYVKQGYRTDHINFRKYPKQY